MNKAKVRGDLELNVQMFGNFQIMNEDGILTAENIHSEMLIRLLTYMISYRNKSQTVQELIDMLWPDNESDNPMGALKNLMYRLRNLLRRTWGDYDFIITGRGIYQWNPQIIMNIDIEAFEQRCGKISSGSSSQEQIEIGKEAVELYKGVFLPELSAEYWVISLSTYYNALYLMTVKKIAGFMEQEQRYTELEHLCRRTLRIESLDEEVHCYLLRALIAENKYQAATEHYEKTVKYFYDTLGVRPSEEIQDIYEEMQKRQHDHQSNIDVIQAELREKDLPKGAFLCEYGVFRKIYTLESRSSSRMGISIHLTLISMYLDSKVFNNKEVYQKTLREGMDILEKTLLNGLRNSDIVCRYSASQFLIMLPACQYEDATMVVNRLKDSFYQSGKTKSIVLQYSIDEINVE